MRLVLATNNPGKAAEIADVLTGVEVVPRPEGVPEPIEDADTLIDNARIKAQALAEATGEPAVPDEGDGRTFAELTRAEKNAVSHRGRAFRALAEALLPFSSR